MSSDMSSGVATAERPTAHRQTTGDVLSYYFQDSDTPPTPIDISRTPSMSTGSNVENGSLHTRKSSRSSGRTPEAVPSPNSGVEDGAKLHRRRSSRTANAGDKRRLAIVELENLPAMPLDGSAVADETPGSSEFHASQLLTRRGLDSARLAIVAPPDAAPITYSNLSPAPPVSAPPRSGNNDVKAIQMSHARSKSTVEGVRHQPSKSYSSRDIGIVGSVKTPILEGAEFGDSRHKNSGLGDSKSISMPAILSPSVNTSVAPIFQRPPTRTPSPDVSTSVEPSPHPSMASPSPWTTQLELITPAIGESKELGIKVAAPVVTMLSHASSRSFPSGPSVTSASGSDGHFARAPTSGSQYPSTDSEISTTYGPSPPNSGSLYAMATARTGEHYLTPGSSHASSPSSDYSQYFAASPMHYPLTVHSPGSHIGYDPVLHATAGDLPEPPRLVPVTPSAPPPRPPRLTPHGRKLEKKTSDSGIQRTPTQTPVVAQNVYSPSTGSNYTATPTASTHSGLPSHLSPPHNMMNRQMSDFSITAVTAASSSDSEQDQIQYSPVSPISPISPGPSSGQTLRSPPSLRRLGSGESEETRHVREGAESLPPSSSQRFPPSAFKRNSKQPEPPSPTLREPRPSPPVLQLDRTSKSSEEERLEEMLASFGPAIMAGSLPPPEPDTPSTLYGTPVSDPDYLPVTPLSVPASSSPLPDLPADTLREQQDVTLQRGLSTSTEKPTRDRSSPQGSSDTHQSGPSLEGSSLVHLSRQSSPVANISVASEHQRAVPSLSLPPAGSSYKRASTERSPSFGSMGRFAARAQFKATALTSPLYTPKASRRAKAVAVWPDAMRFEDVLKKKTSLERANGYARKINELARVRTGLADWMVMVKMGPPTPDTVVSRTDSLLPVGPRTIGDQRKTSGGSQMSDASFPRRPDATVATELSSRDTGDSPPYGPPATLPYPSLAQGIGIRSNSTRSAATALSMNSASSATSLSSAPSSSKKAGGFFSTIGRKNSVARRDRALGPPSSASATLLKQGQSSLAPISAGLESPTKLSRPPLTPSIPGGPRDPPRKSQRSLNLIRRSSVDANASREALQLPLQSKIDKRRSIGPAGLSPPLRSLESHSRPYHMDQKSPNGANAAFTATLQKVADVLPQADKGVLARYLVDANGEDIVAITRYIEDEKKGLVSNGRI